MSYKHKDLIGLRQASKDEILYILERADEFKKLNLKSVKKADYLRGKTVINAFFEDSTRTRISFEIAGKRLGADVINFSSSNSSIKKGETLIDTMQNIEAMRADIFVVRHVSVGAAKLIANNTKASVVNAGDGAGEHPTQALLDIYTIREEKGFLKGLKVSIIGDIEHSRVVRSNIFAMQKLGMEVTLFGPAMMMPLGVDVFGCKVAKNMEDAVSGADVIMMLRVQLERQNGEVLFPSNREYSKFFGLNKHRVTLANSPLILHPGPINRGVEINSDVVESDCSLILDQVENGVAIRMAVLSILNENRGNL
ncbi:MAG: aspartate carbamoyltransferase catalytic subunit [Campylobacter sp.]|nr:aspartate carbamoyltransferase catalytic subunit [Campylobacter sp.]